MSANLQVLSDLLDLYTSSKGQVTHASNGPLDNALSTLATTVKRISGVEVNELRQATGSIQSQVRQNIVNDLIDVESVKNATVTTVKENITNGVDGLIESVLATILKVLGGLGSAIGGVSNKIDGVVDDILDGVSNAIDNISGPIEDLIRSLRDKITGVITALQNVGSDIKNGISSAISGIGSWIHDAIARLVTGVGSWIGGVVGEIGDWLSDKISFVKAEIIDVYNSVKTWLEGSYNLARDNIIEAIEGVKAFADTVKTTVEDKIQDLIEWLNDALRSVQAKITEIVGNILSFVERDVIPRFNTAVEGAKALVGVVSQVWSMIASGDYKGAFKFLDDFAKGIGLPAPVETLHAIVSAFAYFYLSVELQFVPAHVAAQKQAVVSLAMDPIDLSAAAQAVYKGVASEADFYQNASLAGIAPKRASMALESLRSIPTPGAIQEAFLRGEIDEGEHDRLLSSYGYTEKDLQLFKALYWIIPPPTDLIRMSVREVFSPEIAERFGQFEDFPEAFVEWSAKIGISEDWAKRYWASHWDLPSPQMGFEMLHRGIIDNEELKLLLRALDVMPYWREKLIQLSYNPLTRVDVRRMFQLGVLNEEQVHKAYLDLGYSPEKAGWLTEFTKRYSAPEDESELSQFRTLARSAYSQAYVKRLISKDEYTAFLKNLKYYPDDIELLIKLDEFKMSQNDKLFDLQDYKKDFLKLSLQAYDRGIIRDTELTPLLIDLGYTEGEATLEINLVNYNRELTLRSLLIDRLHEQYVEFIIDNVGLNEVLSMYNFTSVEIDKLLQEWNIERAFRTKRPTLTDLRRFLDEKLITLEEFLDELRGIGYHEKYIKLYSQMLMNE